MIHIYLYNIYIYILRICKYGNFKNMSICKYLFNTKQILGKRHQTKLTKFIYTLYRFQKIKANNLYQC